MSKPKLSLDGGPEEHLEITEEDELQALLGVAQATCGFDGCENTELDERGPVRFMGKDGLACVDHWQNVMAVIGQQPIFSDDVGDAEVDTFLRGFAAIQDQLAPDSEDDYDDERAAAADQWVEEHYEDG